jgi:hypothetical protein
LLSFVLLECTGVEMMVDFQVVAVASSRKAENSVPHRHRTCRIDNRQKDDPETNSATTDHNVGLSMPFSSPATKEEDSENEDIDHSASVYSDCAAQTSNHVDNTSDYGDEIIESDDEHDFEGNLNCSLASSISVSDVDEFGEFQSSPFPETDASTPSQVDNSSVSEDLMAQMAPSATFLPSFF